LSEILGTIPSYGPPPPPPSAIIPNAVEGVPFPPVGPPAGVVCGAPAPEIPIPMGYVPDDIVYELCLTTPPAPPPPERGLAAPPPPATIKTSIDLDPPLTTKSPGERKT
jgi:hypothetical protein